MSFFYYPTNFLVLVTLLEFMLEIRLLCLRKIVLCIFKVFINFEDASLMLIFKFCNVRK